VHPTSGAVQAVFSEPLISNIIASGKASDEAFLIENRVGKGASFYFPGMFGEFFEETQAQVYPRLLAGMLGPMPLGVSGAPNLMDVHLRVQSRQKRTMVHLVNLELGPIDEIVPAHRVVVQVQVPYPVKTAMALRAEKTLTFKQRGAQVTLALPELREFEVIALEG